MRDELHVKPLIDIPRMLEISQGMLSDCLEVFSTGDKNVLEDFSERDDVIDALFDQVRREYIVTGDKRKLG